MSDWIADIMEWVVDAILVVAIGLVTVWCVGVFFGYF